MQDDTPKCPPNRPLQSAIAARFLASTKTSENVSRRPLRPRFHARPTDHAFADPRPARIRRPAGLDHRHASQRGRLRRVRNGNCAKQLLDAARRREIDVVLVWRLDRWGRSVADLLSTLQELEHLGVGFVSLTEALDLTTPAGRAMAGLLAVFAEFEREILRERVRAGLAHARQERQTPRPPAVRGSPSRRSPEAIPARNQQIRDRTPASDRPNLRPPPPGPKEILIQAALRSLAGSTRIHRA